MDPYSASLTSGAILTGFSGTFLAFRLQREASYYRQPSEGEQDGEALTHFTAPLLLLLIATALAFVFGFAFPLAAIAFADSFFEKPRWIAGGQLCSLVFLASYFVGELIHYEVFRVDLEHDCSEWRRQIPVLVSAVAAVSLLAAGVSRCVPAA